MKQRLDSTLLISWNLGKAPWQGRMLGYAQGIKPSSSVIMNFVSSRIGLFRVKWRLDPAVDDLSGRSSSNESTSVARLKQRGACVPACLRAQVRIKIYEMSTF